MTRDEENRALPREEVGGGRLSSSQEVKVQWETMQSNPERGSMLQLFTVRTSKGSLLLEGPEDLNGLFPTL